MFKDIFLAATTLAEIGILPRRVSSLLSHSLAVLMPILFVMLRVPALLRGFQPSLLSPVAHGEPIVFAGFFFFV
jgi:hypothetical protein